MNNQTFGLNSSLVTTLPATSFSLFPLLLSLHFPSQLSAALSHLRDIHAFDEKKEKISEQKVLRFPFIYLIFSMMISCPGLALIVTSLSFCLEIWQFGNEDIISIFLLGCQVWMETDHPPLVGLKIKRSASVPPED